MYGGIGQCIASIVIIEAKERSFSMLSNCRDGRENSASTRRL